VDIVIPPACVDYVHDFGISWQFPPWRGLLQATVHFKLLQRVMKHPKNIRDEVVIWLRDAYSMERGLESMLSRQFGAHKGDSEVQKAKIAHLARTRMHVATIESLLNSLGSRIPAIETGFIMAEAMQIATASLSHDESIKDLLTCYAMEHFEVACYKTVIAAAKAAHLPYVAKACEDIIADEEKMAQTIDAIIPSLVEDYLGKE
jgi:ferritin-like metal-binding protein YciE